MTRMKLDGETGSPFMVPHQRMPFDPTPFATGTQIFMDARSDPDSID
jgi:hypothetical protein